MTAKKAQLAAPLENVTSISVALPNLAEPMKSKKAPALALFGTLFIVLQPILIPEAVIFNLVATLLVK